MASLKRTWGKNELKFCPKNKKVWQYRYDTNKNKYITYRYRYPGDILSGLVKFYEVAIHLKEKNERQILH